LVYYLRDRLIIKSYNFIAED